MTRDSLGEQVVGLLNDINRDAYYASEIARDLRRNDTWLKWLVAAAGCYPFVDYMRSAAGEDVITLVRASIPLVSLALPLVDYGGRIEVATKMHTGLLTLLVEVEAIRNALIAATAPAQRVLDDWEAERIRLAQRHSELRAEKTKLPRSRRASKRRERLPNRYQWNSGNCGTGMSHSHYYSSGSFP
jgi:hypothetical protein